MTEEERIEWLTEEPEGLDPQETYAGGEYEDE